MTMVPKHGGASPWRCIAGAALFLLLANGGAIESGALAGEAATEQPPLHVAAADEDSKTAEFVTTIRPRAATFGDYLAGIYAGLVVFGVAQLLE